MGSGNFNRRVTIEKIKDNPIVDAHGEVDLSESDSWEVYAVRWAEIQTKGGREFWKVDKVEAEVSHLIRVPYDRLTMGITPEMRIKFMGRIINIVSAIDINEMHEIIEMQCREPK